MYVCIYVCMYVYIHTCIHTQHVHALCMHILRKTEHDADKRSQAVCLVPCNSHTPCKFTTTKQAYPSTTNAHRYGVLAHTRTQALAYHELFWRLRTAGIVNVYNPIFKEFVLIVVWCLH